MKILLLFLNAFGFIHYRPRCYSEKGGYLIFHKKSREISKAIRECVRTGTEQNIKL